MVNPERAHDGPARRTHSNKRLRAEKEIKDQLLDME